MLYDLYKLVFLLRQKMALPHITLFLTSYNILTEYFATCHWTLQRLSWSDFSPKITSLFFNKFSHLIVPFWDQWRCSINLRGWLILLLLLLLFFTFLSYSKLKCQVFPNLSHRTLMPNGSEAENWLGFDIYHEVGPIFNFYGFFHWWYWSVVLKKITL